MNLQTSNRRQDMPVRLGNHGYRLDGDYAALEAELHIPPYLSGQGFGLELWACPTPHGGGELQGVKLAELPLDLPTPIGPHLHRVEARAPLTPPAGVPSSALTEATNFLNARIRGRTLAEARLELETALVQARAGRYRLHIHCLPGVNADAQMVAGPVLRRVLRGERVAGLARLGGRGEAGIVGTGHHDRA